MRTKEETQARYQGTSDVWWAGAQGRSKSHTASARPACNLAKTVLLGVICQCRATVLLLYRCMHRLAGLSVRSSWRSAGVSAVKLIGVKRQLWPRSDSPLVTTKLVPTGMRWKTWLNLRGLTSPSGCK